MTRKEYLQDQLEGIRAQKNVIIREQNYEGAAKLRDREKQVMDELSIVERFENMYEKEKELFQQLASERSTEKGYGTLSLEHLKKSWFAVVESSGGAAESDKDSSYKEEKALYYIEKAIQALEK